MEKCKPKPILAQALGDDWQYVSPLVRAHYGLHPDSDELLELNGVMSVYYPRPAILLLGFARLMGGLVLLREDDVPVTVVNSSLPGKLAMFWHRSFFVPGKKKPVIFRSRMEYAGGTEVVEFIGASDWLSMGIKMKITQVNGAIHFDSTRYLLKVGSLQVPIPGHFLLGRASIFEKALDEDTILMGFSIKHPLWGEVYTYSGTFSAPISQEG